MISNLISMDSSTINIQIPAIDSIKDKSQVLNVLLEQLYLSAPSGFINAYVNVDRGFHLDELKVPVPDVFGSTIKYEIVEADGKKRYVYANGGFGFNVKDILEYFIINDLQSSGKKVMLDKGLGKSKASQLSTISRLTITLHNNKKFDIDNISYLSEKDIQNLEYQEIFEPICFNYDDFNRGVVIFGELKLNKIIDYTNIFTFWKNSIRSLHFSDKYIVDTRFTESLKDQNLQPNNYSKLVQSIYDKKTEEREKRKRMIFIEDLSKVNPESVIGLISESRPLNASVIINIPSLTLLSEELRNAVFGNIETFLIGSLSVAEQNLISKYLPKIEKSQLQKIHMEKYGYIVFSSKPSGEIRNELYTYKNTSFPRPS